MKVDYAKIKKICEHSIVSSCGLKMTRCELVTILVNVNGSIDVETLRLIERALECGYCDR